jgi:CelD/BcsL family acetyltransferase involved in cellulose biosynthesis
VERVSDPEKIRDTLARFIAIEQSGWKAGTKIGLAKDERHRGFYEDLVLRMAGRNRVVFHFLMIGQKDVAGSVCFVSRNIIYGRHTAYLPAYAASSPGTVLHAEIMREGFAGPLREFDLLGMREDGSSLTYKAHWATGKRETIHWTGYRVWSRMLPLIAAKRFKRSLSGSRCASEGAADQPPMPVNS